MASFTRFALLLVIAFTSEIAAHSGFILKGNSKSILSKWNRANKTQTSLPDMCGKCLPAGGMHDPFKKSYCQDKYTECGCCRDAVAVAENAICKQFLGYGGCKAGIDAKTAEIDDCISKARVWKDKMNDLKKKQINDALGKDVLNLEQDGGVVADKKKVKAKTAKNSSSNKAYPTGMYKDECFQDCKSLKALCTYEYGCSRDLNDKVTAFGFIKSKYELYTIKYEEWTTVYDKMCPDV